MATIGIKKGFKYITQIFVVKDRDIEMEIGFPTDVKHVAHIGWDGASSSANAPSWMNNFNSGPDFSASSQGNTGEPRESYSTAISTWTSQDFDQSVGRGPSSEIFNDYAPTDIPQAPKKSRRKKIKSTTSSPKSSSSRASRASKAKSTAMAMEATTA